MGASPTRTEPPSPHVAADEAAMTPAGSGAPVRAGTVSPAQLLALQRSAGNGAVARAVRGGSLRAARARISRLVKNPLDEAAAWKDAAGASAALDAYGKLSLADRRTAVATSYKKDLVRVLAALSKADQMHKYRAAIMEIARAVQEEETRASAGMTDDQIATVQKDWMKKKAEDAAKAAAAAKAPKGPPPPPPTAAEIEAERQKAVDATSIPAAGPSGWGALPAKEKTKWTARAKAAIKKVVALATAKHPELGVTEANFRIAFKDVEERGAGVLAFGEESGGVERAAVGFEFVTAVELNPAYVMDVVVHELYGHPEYGEYGTEYHLALYDKAMAKMPGYVKPAAASQARTSEIDAYAYQETEMYSVLRSMPYRTAPTGADVGKVPDLDTQTIVDWRVGLMKDQWAPALIVPILRGYRMRLVIDPRITGPALGVFDRAVQTKFGLATLAKVKA